MWDWWFMAYLLGVYGAYVFDNNGVEVSCNGHGCSGSWR